MKYAPPYTEIPLITVYFIILGGAYMPQSIRPVRHEPIPAPSFFNPMDPSEASGKKVAKVASSLTKVVSQKKQKKLFGMAYKLAGVEQRIRSNKIFKDSELTQNVETLKMKKSIDKESEQRLKKEEAVFSGSKAVQAISIKKFLKNTKTLSNKAMHYLNIGFDIARTSIDSAEKIILNKDTIKSDPKFKVAWKDIKSKLDLANMDQKAIDSTKDEFAFFVNLSIQCVHLDTEIDKLSSLKNEISKKNKELKGAHAKDKNHLKLEVDKLKQLKKEQEQKINSIRKDLSLSGLNTLVSARSKCSNAINSLLKSTSNARFFLAKTMRYLPLIKGLFTFTAAVTHLIKSGNEIYETEKKIDILKKEQKNIPKSLKALTRSLINKTYDLKIRHLEQSRWRLKTEAALTMLRAVVASIKLSKATLICLTILFGVVIAVPGLNTTAIVLGILVFVGIKAMDIMYTLKYDREPTKLHLQSTEESTKIFALSGKFHIKANEYQKIQKEMDSLAGEENEINSLIKDFHKNKTAYTAEEFSVIETYLALQVNPIINKRNQLYKKHALLHDKLFMMSLELDAIIAKKNLFQDHLHIDKLSKEFNMQKSDLIRMADLFKITLESESIKKEFVNFLTDKGIAITSEDDIFASVLRFIHADAEMLE